MRCFFFIVLLSLFNLCSTAQEVLTLKKLAGNLKTIQVTINNKRYDFLFDTGGSETFISPEVLAAIGKKAHGKSIGYRMSGESITYQHGDSIMIGLGTQQIFHSSVGVWDIMSLLPKDFPRIDGVISLKTFSNHLITLDIASNSLVLETARSFNKKIKGATLIQSKFANGISGQELTIFLGVIKNGNTYWFLFDSANLDNVRFSHQTAYEWGLEDANQVTRKELNDQLLKLGHRTIKTNVASTEIIHDGVLNYEVISQFKFHIDLKKNRVWIN